MTVCARVRLIFSLFLSHSHYFLPSHPPSFLFKTEITLQTVIIFYFVKLQQTSLVTVPVLEAPRSDRIRPHKYKSLGRSQLTLCGWDRHWSGDSMPACMKDRFYNHATLRSNAARINYHNGAKLTLFAGARRSLETRLRFRDILTP